MTLRELSSLYWLRRQVEEIEERLWELERAGRKPNDDIQGAQRYEKAKERVRQHLADKRRECLEEELRLREYIHAIPDVQTQLMMTLRFVDGLSWQQVADRIGGGNTADGVRKRCRRWIDKNPR